jgi:probable F420-dependent oxidoreductase
MGMHYGQRLSSAPMQRLGVVFPDRSRPLRAQRPLVERLAAWGYTDLWAGESDGADAFTPLAVAAGWGTPLRLGTAVVSPFLRPAALLAMSAATLADAAAGGFVLGIGASSPVIVERWNSVAFADPLARVRSAAVHLRALLAGDKRDGFRVHRTPAPVPPVYVGALRPAMLRVAREAADGVVLTCVGAGDLEQVRPHLAAGHETVAWITVCPSTDAAAVRAAARPRLAAYLASPAYEAQQRWLGRAALLEPVWQAWRSGAGLAAAAAALPDEVIDALVVHGTPEQCHEHLARFVAGGVTTPILELLPGVLEPDEAWRRLAPRA